MVSLVSKSTRDSINLDTYARNIVWSAILLKSSLVNTNNFSYNFSITAQSNNLVRISANLLYNKNEFYIEGLDIVDNIISYNESQAQVYTKPISPTPNNVVAIDNDPPNVDTLEKFFIWSCLKFATTNPDSLNLRLFDNAREGSLVQLSINIPFDYVTYANTNNILDTITTPNNQTNLVSSEVWGVPLDTVLELANQSNVLIGQIHYVAETKSFYVADNSLNTSPDGNSVIEITSDSTKVFNKLFNPGNGSNFSGNADDITQGTLNNARLNSNVVIASNTTNKLNSISGTLNANKLTNLDEIDVSELAGTENFVKTINGNSPDASGNVVVSGGTSSSIDWSNVQNKPNFANVSTTGDYADLTNKPSIPTNQWGDLQGKPTFSSVAISGSYNDLLDKPNLSNNPGGTNVILGKKVLSADQSSTLIFTSAGNLDGIINWMGTQENSVPYNNPFGLSILFLDHNSNDTAIGKLFDKLLSFSGFSFTGSSNNSSTMQFPNHEVKISKMALYAGIRPEYLLKVSGSNDNINWQEEQSFSNPHSATGWLILDVDHTQFYDHILFEYERNGGGNTWSIYEIEIWGEVRVKANVPNGSLNYNLQGSDFGYLLAPSASIGTISLLPLSTVGINVGDKITVYNPNQHPVQIVPANGDSLLYAISAVTLAKDDYAVITKVSNTEWSVQ